MYKNISYTTIALILVFGSAFVFFSKVSAQSTPPGYGIIGDSNSDEYRADDNRGGTYAATTLNFVELLVRNGNLNFGSWGTWGEPRRTGYKYNWSRSAARLRDMITTGQHTGLAQQIQNGEVKHVFISIGTNDFHIWNNTYNEIYNGTLSDAQVQTKVNQMIADITLAVDTVKNAGAESIVVSNISDPGLHPMFISAFPVASGRERVSAAINQYNAAVLNLATTKNIGFFDQHAWGVSLLNRVDSNGFLNVGGELINTTVMNNEPHHFQLGDSVGHMGTVANGLVANEWFIAPLNQKYGLNLVPFTEQEIITNAGIITNNPTPTPTATPTATPSVTPSPTPTPTVTPSPTPTATPTPSVTPSPMPTATPTPTPTPTSQVGWNFTPSSYSIITGKRLSGNLSSVTSNNNSYLVVKSQTSGTTRFARTEYTFSNFTGVTSASKLTFTINAFSNVSATNGKIMILKASTGQWETLSTFTLGTTEGVYTGVVNADLATYANTSGVIKLRLETSKGKTTTTTSTDFVQLTVTP